MKALIVDDSKTIRNIQKRMLAELGITEVFEAQNGYEALNHYKANEIDLILLDWNMPMMNGITFLRCIRTRTRKVVVIMVTTEGEATRVLEAVQLGATDYVVKPFTKETLFEKIAKHTGLAPTPTAAAS